jgi:putative redox protein
VTAVTVVRWIDAQRFEASLSHERTLTLESSAEDHDTVKPAQLLLVALAGCTAMDVISICRKKRVDLSRYEVHVSGTQRDAHPRTFSEILVEHHFEGDHVDDVAVRRSVHLSASRYCVVNAHLSAGDTTIHHVCVISDRSGTRREEVLATGPQGAGLEPSPMSAR